MVGSHGVYRGGNWHRVNWSSWTVFSWLRSSTLGLVVAVAVVVAVVVLMLLQLLQLLLLGVMRTSVSSVVRRTWVTVDTCTESVVASSD